MIKRSDYQARLYSLGRGLWVVCVDLEGKAGLGPGLLSQIQLMTQLPTEVQSGCRRCGDRGAGGNLETDGL